MNLINGRIIKGIGGFYYVETPDSLNFIECKARGNLRYKDSRPIVGDYVLIDSTTKPFVITEIKDRKNALVRPNVSNVDYGLLLVPVNSPKADLLLLDKLIVNCISEDIEPIICISKVDLDEKLANNLKIEYEKIGLKVFLLSNNQEDEIKELMEYIKGSTSFLAGQSGAGKSTFSNRVCDSQMQTGDISKKSNRGKHTTRHVELLKTKNNSYLLDTPGFSTLELLDSIEPEDLKKYYPDFSDSNCKYNNCNHIKEPGCSVRDKVKKGKIDMDRYLRYKSLFKMLTERKKY